MQFFLASAVNLIDVVMIGSLGDAAVAASGGANQIFFLLNLMLFGINFNLFFFIVVGKIKDVFQNEELKTYLILCGVATAIISINTYQIFNNMSSFLRVFLKILREFYPFLHQNAIY